MSSEALLNVDAVSKRYGGPSQPLVLRDVSLHVAAGECVALVGESGSGKTTLAHVMSGLERPTSGRVTIDGLDVARVAEHRRGRASLSRSMQLVFQGSHGSLDPTKTVENLVAEPLLGHVDRRMALIRVREVLDTVALPAAFAHRSPKELSGGQRQRVGIARALAVAPRLLIMDEPVASLDVSIQGQILELLNKIREETGVAILMIAHDLGVVRSVSSRTLVMYRGSLVEQGPTERVLSSPLHPYTQSLLWSATSRARSSVPEQIRAIYSADAGSPPEDAGCVFRSRCWRKIARCESEVDTARGTQGHAALCNVPMNVEAKRP